MPETPAPAHSVRPGARSERERLDGADFEPVAFFVLRTPLLTIDELEAWGTGLQAPTANGDELEEALERDRQTLRGWLRDLLQRPAVVEALHLASPSLLAALEYWRRNPRGKKGRRAEQALVRYAVRMCARSTPFGLFGGCTVGRVGGAGSMRLGPESSYRRHSRLDTDYLFSVAHELDRDHSIRGALRYRPNSSLYRAAGRLRYAESRLEGRHRTHHLVAVEPDEFLDAALERASGGATVGEIAAALVACDPDGEVTHEEAAAFVDELIDTQLLVSDLWPAVTGAEAVHGMIDALERSGHGGAEILRRTQGALEELDRQGLGRDPARYREIADGLASLPASGDKRHLYQVDLVKPGEPVLDANVADEIARAVEIHYRLSGSEQFDLLQGFRDRFLGRYEQGRLVPLVEALDDEVGVGFSAGGVGADASRLLRGIHFSGGGEKPRHTWEPRFGLLLDKVTEACSARATEAELTDDDLEKLRPQERPPMPDSFQVMAKIAAASEEALAAGEFRIWLRNVFGPSGARIVGRFCHADERLTELVEDHLRAEEALDPDLVFAEVVHLPNGRVGNVASRPVLRGWEIPYLGVSGAPPERQIPLEDLLVTVAGREVVLVSSRLGRRVVPRLTNAHNYVSGSLGIYHFLGALQGQGVRNGLPWSWGPLARLPFLPRIRYGRTVLCHARWRVGPDEVERLVSKRGADRFRALRRWREERGIPRRVMLGEEETELLVDFDNVLSVDAFLPVIRTGEDVVLEEVWPGPDEHPVRGPEGRFAHEVVLPFLRRRAPTRRTAPLKPVQGVERTKPPTSDWLYLKVFTGTATADRVLQDVIGPVVDRALGSGAADRWFFLRYGEPHWHLRVRFGGEPERLRSVVDLLAEHLDPALEDGRVWRWQLDTYEREVERYGGPAAVAIGERIFHADSDAVLAALGHLGGDSGADDRWRLAFVGIDRLLADFGLDLTGRRDALGGMRASFAAELDPRNQLRQQLANRLREERDELDALLENGVDDSEHPLALALAALEVRSQRLAPLVSELRSLDARDELALPIGRLVPSFVHMFVNRLIRADQRPHELVLYDFLHRITLSRIAREKAAREAPTR